MKVSVEIITGTFIDTDVSEDATVKELKEKIAAEVKLPVTRLILVIGDEETRRMVREDEDEMVLKDLGVSEYSHMYLFFKHPDLVYEEERSQEGGEDDGDPMVMEEASSEAVSRRGNEEQEKAKIDGEEGDEAMKDEDRDVKVEEDDQEEKEKQKNGEAKDNDDVKEEAREGEDGDNKKEN